MNREHTTKYQFVHIQNAQNIRITLISDHDWDELSLEEYKELILVLRQLQRRYPEHRTLFSSSSKAYIELVPSRNDIASTPILHTGGVHDPLYPSIRTLLKSSTCIDIVTAFIQDSGLRILQPLFFDALVRGAHIRILGGDYLHITQGKALQRLLDWKSLAAPKSQNK